MKPRILLLLVLLPFSFLAQHRTEKSSNGNPLTDIVDANSMKQGKWIFYDYDDNIIRTEVYKDHVLQSRNIVIQGKEIDATNYHIDESLKVLLSNNPDFKTVLFFGEAVINEKGDVLRVSFYNKLDSKLENSLTEEILQIIKEKYKGQGNLILTF
jgi:hypothetical protein